MVQNLEDITYPEQMLLYEILLHFLPLHHLSKCY